MDPESDYRLDERWGFFALDERRGFFTVFLLEEGAAFFLVPLSEGCGVLPLDCGRRNAVYFLMKAPASSSVFIARLSDSIISMTTAATCSTCVHRRSDTGRLLLKAPEGSFRMRIIFSGLGILYLSPI
jgi:hypothetical protein